jgi:O-antigen/teichoic acid export membrane protein/radical SAM superfamily enzyme YgiQ (UPF0313 family)
VWGTVPEVFPVDTLNRYQSYTYVLRGDPEPAVRALITALEEGKSLKAVEGLVYRAGDGIVDVPGRPRVADLDDLPWPARDLLQLDRYPETFQGPPQGHMLTSRGCYFSCTFCGAPIYGPFRTRSPQGAVDEMEHLMREYGVNRLVLRDLTLGPARHIRNLCAEMVRRQIRVTWYCLSHPAILSRELLELMREAGCRWIDLGVESGDQSVLDRYRKGVTIEKIQEVFSWCRDLGINAQGNVLLGGPYDNPATIRATVGLLERLDPPRDCVTRVLPIPGTPLFEEVEEAGRLTSREWTAYRSDPYDREAPAPGLISHAPETEDALDWAFRRLGGRRRRRGLVEGLASGRWLRRVAGTARREAGQAWKAGVIHVFGGEGVSKAAGMVTTMALARLLGAEAYGHLGVINAVMALATALGTFGLAAGVTKFVSQYPKRASGTFATSVRTGLLTSVVVASGLFALASYTGAIRDEVARSFLRLLAWSLPALVVGSLGLGFLYGLKRLRLKSWLKAALDVSRVGLLVGGGWFLALPGVIGGKVVAAVASCATGLAVARGRWHWRDRSPDRSALLRFAGFSVLGASFSTLLVTTDTLTISTLLGSAAVVGHYRVAALLALALTMPAGALAHAAFPYISENQARTDRVSALIARLMKRTVAVSAPLCIVGWIAGGLAIRLLFGGEFGPSVVLFRVLVIGAFFRSVVGLVGTSIHALGRPDVNLGLLLVTGTLNIALNILLVQRLGAVGAAWATSIVCALNLVLGWWALRRLVLVKPD